MIGMLLCTAQRVIHLTQLKNTLDVVYFVYFILYFVYDIHNKYINKYV